VTKRQKVKLKLHRKRERLSGFTIPTRKELRVIELRLYEQALEREMLNEHFDNETIQAIKHIRRGAIVV
jgi:hypothetical protein